MKPASNKSNRDDLMTSGVISTGGMVAGASGQSVRMVPDQVPYYFQQQQQQHQAAAQPTAATLQPQIIQLQVIKSAHIISFHSLFVKKKLTRLCGHGTQIELFF